MKSIKALTGEIHRGKQLEKNLPEYKEKAFGIYKNFAVLSMVFSFYLYREEIEESEWLPKQEMMDLVLEGMRQITDPNCDFEMVICQMDDLREQIRKQMDLLTSYTDCLICYEYILNRMEKRFEEEKEWTASVSPEAERVLLQKLLAFLFQTEDQVEMNENIRAVLGQLPVRLVKSKFYDRLCAALTLYQDGDKMAVDEFVYMIRTSGMLYEPELHSDDYKQIDLLLQKLDTCDYTNCKKEEFESLAAELENAAHKIQVMTDLYYSMQQIANQIYATALCEKNGAEQTEISNEGLKFLAAHMKKNTEEKDLVRFEGEIEKYVEASSYVEAILDEIRNAYTEELRDFGLTEAFSDLARTASLLSGSLFIDLGKSQNAEKADGSQIQKISETLIQEFEQKFAKSSRQVKRAIMAQVLAKLPIPFQTAEEIKVYIEQSLFGCQDMAEKAAVMEILNQMMEA